MRDEVRRINKLVAEGKLSPDDAADLIDAFYASERDDEEPAANEPTPPPPPGEGSSRDPFRGIIDQIEKLTKEGVDSVDWKEFSKQTRESAKKGFDFLRSGLEEISKGKVQFGFFGSIETRDLDLPLSVPEGKTLKIENACGDVHVTGGVEGEGKVHAKARFRGANLEDARAKAQGYTLIVEEGDHQVIIRQQDISGLTVDLEISLPGTAPVEIKTEAGDLKVEATGSSCRVQAGAGDISLSGLNGPIEVNSGAGDLEILDSETSSLVVEDKSGNILIRNVKGNMNVRSATGDLKVIGCTGRVIALESISGDVTVDIVEPVTGSLSVRTVNGDARVDIPDGSDCRVSLSTLRGDVACGIDLHDASKAQQRVTGKLGEGLGSVDISAVTGDVHLDERKTETAPV